MADRPALSLNDQGTGRPAVVPRARRLGGEASVPVDRLVASAAHGRGLILLVGGPGGGKTTALQYLAATLPPDVSVTLCDTHQSTEARRAVTTGVAVLATVDTPSAAGAIDVFTLCPWTVDDCLEYLVAAHRGACASVLKRIAADPSFDLLAGVPELVAMVLDVMAGQEGVATARDALRLHAARVLTPVETFERLMTHGTLGTPLMPQHVRWLRHPGFEQVCTADWIVAELGAGRLPGKLLQADLRAPALVVEIAVVLRDRPGAFEHLRAHAEADVRSDAVPMVATLLLAADPAWRPSISRGINLARAALHRAQWAGLDLSGALLTAADLRDADLNRANLTDATASAVDLTGANLRGATLDAGRFRLAVLRSADLSVASLAMADLNEADLAQADLRRAHCVGATFVQSDLTGVRATSADISEASLSRVDCADANFTAATFTGARLEELDMTKAEWTGARFARATLLRCNLEGLELPDADFAGAKLTGSLLTGSRFPAANFRGADLSRTGLADIDWPDADLRDADFTGVSFHLGTTRSGLVGSTIAGEGSRTGFYTDDFNDQAYKPPEEIRKACLTGANLVGATVEHTDFYLVDLRGATYTEDQRLHFARTGAILATRAAG